MRRHRARRLAPAHEAAETRGRVWREHGVEDGQVLRERHLLEGGLDAERVRVPRAREPRLAAGEREASGVGHGEPAQHPHERALARAVLAEERVHLARREREIDAVVGEEVAVTFRDACQAHERRGWALLGEGRGQRLNHAAIRV